MGVVVGDLAYAKVSTLQKGLCRVALKSGTQRVGQRLWDRSTTWGHTAR